MAEIGVDISGGKPAPVGDYLDQPWDLVVTVCDSAKEACPVSPRPVPRMAVFRRVRDEIRDRLVPEVRSRS